MRAVHAYWRAGKEWEKHMRQIRNGGGEGKAGLLDAALAGFAGNTSLGVTLPLATAGCIAGNGPKAHQCGCHTGLRSFRKSLFASGGAQCTLELAAAQGAGAEQARTRSKL